MLATLAIHIARNCCLGVAGAGVQAAAFAEIVGIAETIGAARNPASNTAVMANRRIMKESLTLQLFFDNS
jgi:hypothetical protein